MNIKPFFNISHIKDPFWYGFWQVFSHTVWLVPLAFIVGSLLGAFYV